MPSRGIRRCLSLAFAILIISQASPATFADVSTSQWRETPPTRVIIRSTADWGRILFDDFNGANSNGIRIRTVVDSGWLEGRDSDDQIHAGRKIAWPDMEYDKLVAREGDMVAFFKGLGDFHLTEMYADLILEINIEVPWVHLWLMTGGNGTTTFEIVSRDTGETIWRDIVVASGETQQVRRVMSPQAFSQPGRTESSIVVTWLLIVVIVVVVLNFPILEYLGRFRRSRSRSGTVSGSNRRERDDKEAPERR